MCSITKEIESVIKNSIEEYIQCICSKYQEIRPSDLQEIWNDISKERKVVPNDQEDNEEKSDYDTIRKTKTQSLKDDDKSFDYKYWEKVCQRATQQIVGIECWKCEKAPYGAFKREDWCLYLHSNCGYCGEENAITWKWSE